MIAITYSIVDERGRVIAPPQSNPRAALRGEDVRRALAGERPIWRRVVDVERPASVEVLAELAMGRRS